MRMCCNVPLGIALSCWVFVTAAGLKIWGSGPAPESSERICAVLWYHKHETIRSYLLRIAYNASLTYIIMPYIYIYCTEAPAWTLRRLPELRGLPSQQDGGGPLTVAGTSSLGLRASALESLWDVLGLFGAPPGGARGSRNGGSGSVTAKAASRRLLAVPGLKLVRSFFAWNAAQLHLHVPGSFGAYRERTWGMTLFCIKLF